MYGRRMRGGRARPRRCRRVRPHRDAELGKSAGQLGTGPEPSGDLQWLPEAVLARWRVNDRPAGRTRVEILADPAELLTWLRGDAGNDVDDRVPRAERGLRRRGPQRDRRLLSDADVR